MEDREKVVYAKCADYLDVIARVAKCIYFDNFKQASEILLSTIETVKHYLATERISQEDVESEKYSDAENIFNEIGESVKTISSYPNKSRSLIRQFGIKLNGYAREKATVMRDEKLVDTKDEDDWFRMF